MNYKNTLAFKFTAKQLSSFIVITHQSTIMYTFIITVYCCKNMSKLLINSKTDNKYVSF